MDRVEIEAGDAGSTIQLRRRLGAPRADGAVAEGAASG
jgi:hypothetical protein